MRISGGRATTQKLPKCGMDHSSVDQRRASNLLWHPCPTCYSGYARGPLNDIEATLRDLKRFKATIDGPVGQQARIAIKRSIQKIDQSWLITILRKMKKKKKVHRNFRNPWCAFESVIAEPPFDVFDMPVGQVAMLYHTVKDHLMRHSPVLSSRATGSLWDFVPETTASVPVVPVAPVAPVTPAQAAPEASMPMGSAAVKEEDEEDLMYESQDASFKWAERTTQASEASMPFNHKVANFVIVLLATTLAVAASYAPTTADSSPPHLQ